MLPTKRLLCLRLRLSLVNIYGVEEYVTRIQMPPKPIEPGETLTFEHTIFNFTANAADILMLFLKRSEDLYSNISLANPEDIPYSDPKHNKNNPKFGNDF